MNSDNITVKRLFRIVIVVGVVGIALQSSIIASVWYIYMAGLNELETLRIDAEIGEATDILRTQNLILNRTDRIVEGLNNQDNLTRGAVEILLGNTEGINLIGNGTTSFQQKVLQQLNETTDEMDNHTEVISGRIDQLIELLVG